jgi:AhpC/TSA family
MARQTPSMRHLLVLSLLLLSVLGATNVVTALEIGEQAPDFVLPSTTGDKISLQQFRGKQLVLIEFYTNDFVPT